MFEHLSRIFHEVRIMSTQLPAWRFLILSIIGLVLALTPALYIVVRYW